MPAEIISQWLDQALTNLSDACTLRLFSNNYTPVAASVAGDFTEANFSGYSSLSCTYNAATVTGTKGERESSGIFDFTHNGGATNNDIYGWYVTRNADSQVQYAHRFSTAPVTLDANGERISLQLIQNSFEDGDEVASDFIFPNVGELRACNRVWEVANTYRVRLFKSNITPSDSDTLSTYTSNEATFSGYAGVIPVFTAGAAIVGTRAESTSDLMTFTRNLTGTAETIYGYFIERRINEELVAAQQFAAPITVTNNGDRVEFKLTVSAESVN